MAHITSQRKSTTQKALLCQPPNTPLEDLIAMTAKTKDSEIKPRDLRASLPGLPGALDVLETGHS